MHDQSFLKIVTEEMLNPLSVEGGGGVFNHTPSLA